MDDHTFWSDNVDIKLSKFKNTFFRSIELAGYIPSWTVSEYYQNDHTDAMKWMRNSKGPVFNINDSYYLSLKQEYATVFTRNMESPLMAKARLAGFNPLFLLKNAIIQETHLFGLNGHQVTTIDIKPKSYLALVAFYKGSGKDLQIITLTNESNNVMVIRNM